MTITTADIQARFPEFEKALVEEIVENAEMKLYQNGEYLVRQGHYIRSTYLVFDGLVKVIRENGNDNQLFIYYLKSGQACVLSMYATRSLASLLTVKAVEPTAVLFIPFSCTAKWMVQYKSWTEYVWQNFRSRIEELFDILDNTAFRNMGERLIYYLKRQSKQLGVKDLPITQTEIAKELNSSREVIARLLKKLSDRGSIKLHRSFIEINHL